MKTLLSILCALALLAVATPVAGAAPRDRDRDGLPDRWELRHHLSIKMKTTNADPDRDRVDNRNELRQGTNPRVKDSNRNRTRDGREDTDRDGLANASEDRFGQDPDDPDTDDDGLIDGREGAGVVRSRSRGVLVIDLLAGGTVEARVSDDETDIGCGTEADAEAIQDRSPGEEPDDPSEEELESEEISEADAASEDGDDGDRGLYDFAESDFGPEDEDAADTTDSEYQDDLHDFEDVCEVADLRRGTRIREVSVIGSGFDEIELMLAP